jgi:DNA-binding beta-propeller fold protein YncE
MKPTRKVMYGGATAAALVAALGLRPAVDAARQGPMVQAPRFEVDPLWPRPLPNHWILGSVVGVAVDARDHVFVLNLNNTFTARTEIGAATNPPTGECCVPAPSVLEFDQAGALVGHWGAVGDTAAWPVRASGLSIDRQGNLWIGGSGGTDTRIFKFARDGKLVGVYGKAGTVARPPAPAAGDTAYAGVGGRGGGGRGGRGGRGAAPAPTVPPNSGSTESFGGAVRITPDPRGNEAFVADGARNRRVAVINARTGAITRTWGAYGNPPDDGSLPAYTPGAAPARQFSGVHCAAVANDGFVYVCDRGNDRIQVFRTDGSFVREQTVAPQTLGAGSVWDIAFSRDPQQKYLYVADGQNMKIHVVDRQSLELVTSFGDGGRYPGQFLAVHSIATDSRGNLYTAETFEGKRVQRFVFRGIGGVARDQGVVRPAK